MPKHKKKKKKYLCKVFEGDGRTLETNVNLWLLDNEEGFIDVIKFSGSTIVIFYWENVKDEED